MVGGAIRWDSVLGAKKTKQTTFSARFPIRASPALETLAANIRDRRKALDLSQAALARSIGVDQTEISKVENGRGNPSVTFAERLAEALRTSLAELFAPRSDKKSD